MDYEYSNKDEICWEEKHVFQAESQLEATAAYTQNSISQQTGALHKQPHMPLLHFKLATFLALSTKVVMEWTNTHTLFKT